MMRDHELPGQRAAERVFGALADGLGLKPLREWAAACDKLRVASLEEGLAQAAFLQCVGQAWTAGLAELPARLATAHGEAGTAAWTPLALLRLWAGCLDAAMHEAMLSDPGLAATAAAVRAGSRRRLALQRLGDLQREALGAPTRQEIDDAFQEIQDLKRALRQLQRAADTGSPAP